MNILIYCDEYPPAKSGGIGSVTKIIAENLVLKGHKIIILGSHEFGHDLPFCSEINGVKVYRLTHYNFLSIFPFFLRKLIKSIFRRIGILDKIAKRCLLRNELFIDYLIEFEAIDCLELVDYMQLLADIESVVIFRKFKVPTIMRIHGSVSFLETYLGSVKRNHLMNDMANFARSQNQLAVSEFSKQFAVQYLKQNENLISVIHNPIEEKFIVKSPHFNRENNNILFLGKITESKGAFQLIKAFNVVGEIYKDWSLIMVGAGDIGKANLLVNSNLRSQVKFTGYLSRDEVMHSIDNAAFCVIPSYFETFGMTSLEVMARGKALIFTNSTSGPEIISNGLDGILINPRQVDEIIDSIFLLIRNQQLAKKIAFNGYKKVVKHFTTDSIVNNLLRHYYYTISEYEKN